MFGSIDTRVSVALLVSLLAGLACGDDADVPDASDAGPGDDALDGALAVGSFVVAPPDIPWLAEGLPPIAPVALTPCPDGWREVTGGDAVECDPYPEGGAEDCGPGEAHFPGEPGCRPVGAACPAGDYPATLPGTGPIVYVNASAATGGDGSMASPHAELSEVSWDTLAAGTTVALAKGTYGGRLLLGAGVSVIGACARETMVTGGASATEAAIVATTAGIDVAVTDVTFPDLPGPAVELSGRAHLSLAGVIIDRARGLGVYAGGAGTQLALTDVVIRGTRGALSDGTLGMGMLALDGARVEATRVLVAENRTFGIETNGAGTEVVLHDVVVRDTLPEAVPEPIDGGRGLGLAAFGGARIEGSRLLVSGNHRTGLLAVNTGSSVALSDAIVRDTRPSAADEALGVGLQVYGGARIDASRLVVAENSTFGVECFSGDEPYAVSLSDTVIRDTEVQSSDDFNGFGIILHGRGRFEASRLMVSGNRDTALFAYDPGVEVVLSDAIIRDTRPAGIDDLRGRGISIHDGARFEGVRLLVDNNLEVGIAATGDTSGADLSLVDAVVRGTRPEAQGGNWGRGLSVVGGSRVTAERMLVADNVHEGIYVEVEGSEVILGDVVIRNTQSRASDGQYGRGIAAWDGARLEATRTLIEGNRGTGLLVSGPMTAATITDVSVIDMLPQEIGDLGGRGVMCQLGARLQGQRLEVDGVFEAGLVAFSDGEVDVRSVRVRRVARTSCSSTTCPDRTFGYAVAAVAGEMHLEDFRIEEAATCGAFIAAFPTLGMPFTSLDLMSGVVSGSEIGACVQVDGYDYGRLTNDVEYRDNGTNLEATMLPVPGAPVTVEP
ncbi:MAG: hypothetical protein DRJ42_09800 [Deltaproteobacteria bacterium]|nr:MAG: hypothetical protein DRJ42_09800 [Deltaproteobacteria bacterium]